MQPSLHNGKRPGHYDRIRKVAGAYARADKRRAAGSKGVVFPSVPEEVVIALRTNLEMTPLEYLATPADMYYELSMVKVAWREGLEEERGAKDAPP